MNKFIFLVFFFINIIIIESVKLKSESITVINKNNQVVQWSFGNTILPDNSSIYFGLEIFSPKIPGIYPVIIFQGGFDGLTPYIIYQDFLETLCIKTNKIIVFLNRLSFIKLPDKEEVLLEKTLNWTLPNLKNLFSKNAPKTIRGKVIPDIDTYGVTLMSHSSSGHSVCSYLNKTCGFIKSLILLDPVDGYDPFGFIKIFITNPPKQLPFILPTLIISNGLDAVSANGKFPACAPVNVSNTRFYDSLPGPTFLLNYTTYGHADILEEYARKYISSKVCKECESDCNYPLYKENIVKGIAYFLFGLELKNQTYINSLLNPSNSTLFDPTVHIESIYKSNGYDINKYGPFCNHL